MTVRELIHALGGPTAVASIVGATPKAVSMWGARDDVPSAFVVALWQMAVRAGVNWTPPGAAGARLVLPEAAA